MRDTTISATLADFNPSIVIVGASGLDVDGLYCGAVQDERPVKEALARRKTATRVIVADHTKLGRTDVRRFISLEDLQKNARRVCIVTNEVDISDLPEDQAAGYQTALNAFRSVLGKDSVILVPVGKAKPESRPTSGRDKGKKAAGAERAVAATVAVDAERTEKREAV